MDIHGALHHYMEKMLQEVDGMKVLLMDRDTAGIMSCVCSQSYLFEHDVFLSDYIDSVAEGGWEGSPLGECKCICLLRPTAQNVDLVVQEIKEPHFCEYHLDFTSFLKNVFIERLAEADEYEVVKGVSEYYADCVAASRRAFSLNLPQCIGEQLGGWSPRALQRSVEGVSAALLSLKRRPAIRFARSSTMAAALANELRVVICDSHRQQFDFRRTDQQPVLLIYDRRADPVSCLLTQWTFQAMLHDLLGIHNNRIKFADTEMALSITQDAFYRDNLYSNYGDLGENMQTLVREYQDRTAKHSRTSTHPANMPDIKQAIHEIPELRRQGDLVNKYVALTCELQRIVDQGRLLERSEAEQHMVMQVDAAAALSLLEGLLTAFADDATRLCLLYVGQFARRPTFNMHSFMNIVKQRCPDPDLVQFAAEYGAAEHGAADQLLAGGEAVIDDTVYTRHISPLTGVVDRVLRGRLPVSDFAFIPTAQSGTATDTRSATDRPTDVIVFVVNGGSLQEECQLQRLVRRQHPHVRLVYGCTAFLNAQLYVEELRRLQRHLSS